ncbi:hypothetical protein [Mycobacteroides abscessus]|uniref:hypothetical protein n=1 Tax=Mycobacteroides abscessus TaxID=36809 RepID=UPI0009D181B7|nr:hypothetical protein [Mycobacteroides abscessus]SLH41714.1 Uncharacterised protein [Mycobacteroides abscessus subsp. massiliense]
MMQVVVVLALIATVGTAALLLLGESVRAVGWLGVGLLRSFGRVVCAGLAYTAAGMLWLAVGTFVLTWLGGAIMGGGEEGVTLGSVALVAVLVVWWPATLWLRDLRLKLRAAQGVPATPWIWLQQSRHA